MRVVLDGGAFESAAQLHETLARELRFPDWYGGNLDALFDCLTDLREDTVICLKNPDGLEKCLGAFGGRVLRVLRQAAEENPHLHLTMEKET